MKTASHVPHPARAISNSRSVHTLLYVVLCASVFVISTSCESGGGDGGSPSNPQTQPYGQRCDEAADCTSGICTASNPESPKTWCSKACSSDEDCANIDGEPAVCAAATGGANGADNVCVPAGDIVPVDDDYGNTCETNSDCDTGFCTTVSANSDDAFCSYPCSKDSDCPQPTDDPSSCIFVQRQGELAKVCAPDDLCIDGDDDQYGTGPGCLGRDCDDNNPNIHPGVTEVCDGIDNDCDGLIDVNIPEIGQECNTGLPGVCDTGVLACKNGLQSCQPNVIQNSRQEICDGLDNDCDGLIDEAPPQAGQENDPNADHNGNFVEKLGQTCGATEEGCFEGLLICGTNSNGQTGLVCQNQVDNSQFEGIADVCNHKDDNCNGEIDEDYRANHPDYGKPCIVGQGACQSGGVLDCDPNDGTAPPVCTATAGNNATNEVCNYFDDNCDGDIDEDFRNSDGVYYQTEHCGSCATDCNKQWSKDPALLHVEPKCVASTKSASCDFDCATGYIDYDALPENGCEFKPDTKAIYVASPDRGGVDFSKCGDYDAPCATISEALSRAKTDGAERVRVGEGSFDGGFTIDSSIELLGGHSSTTWNRDPSLNLTTLRGGTTDGKNTYAIRIKNITGGTSVTLSGFTIAAPDASEPSGNSIGIWVTGADNGLTISDNTILAARGGTGASGEAGDDGHSGGNGGNGSDRVNDKTTCSNNNGVALAGGTAGTNTSCNENVSGGAGASTNCPTAIPNVNNWPAINGVNGDAGKGHGDANNGNKGAAGQSPNHYKAVPPEYSISGCKVDPNDTVSSPTPGLDGGIGDDGSGGQGASNDIGTVSGNTWTGADGSNGGNGSNGGGGGGAGSSGGIYEDIATNPVYDYGPTGGGGGAGGCGATGGTGGQAGGGSFGILLVGSGSSFPKIQNNELHRGQGGQGGKGGIGGVGGSGGDGGHGGAQTVTDGWTRCGQFAADGGDGGRGGHGGGGGGGAGGIAFDIAVSGYTSHTIPTSNTFSVPDSIETGGIGGDGGQARFDNGSTGAHGESGDTIFF